MATAVAPHLSGQPDSIIEAVIAPAATRQTAPAAFPRAALDALGQAGLLGLVSAPDVGGLGQGHRAATQVVERIARAAPPRR